MSDDSSKPVDLLETILPDPEAVARLKKALAAISLIGNTTVIREAVKEQERLAKQQVPPDSGYLRSYLDLRPPSPGDPLSRLERALAWAIFWPFEVWNAWSWRAQAVCDYVSALKERWDYERVWGRGDDG